jgi:hypothetical protein
MDDLNKVLAIYNEHFYGVGAWLGAKAVEQDSGDDPQKLFIDAKQKAKEGLSKLDALKLSAKDNNDLRKAFKELMDACEAGAKGKYVLMQIKATKAIFFVNMYMARNRVRGVKSDG